MPALGEQQFGVRGVANGVSVPPALMVKVSIWPLLEANRKLPSGVAASETPWHESYVSSVGNGEPATRVSIPVAGLIWNEVIVRSPVLATNTRLLIWLRVIRLSP
jgi:hypothetical protein